MLIAAKYYEWTIAGPAIQVVLRGRLVRNLRLVDHLVSYPR